MLLVPQCFMVVTQLHQEIKCRFPLIYYYYYLIVKALASYVDVQEVKRCVFCGLQWS